MRTHAPVAQSVESPPSRTVGGRRFKSSPVHTFPEKLFVVADAALPAGLKIAQTGHALVAWAIAHPEETRRWHRESNYLVCLQAPDLAAVIEKLDRKGVRYVPFREPDLNDQLTAIAVEPAGGQWLSHLRLAR